MSEYLNSDNEAAWLEAIATTGLNPRRLSIASDRGRLRTGNRLVTGPDFSTLTLSSAGATDLALKAWRERHLVTVAVQAGSGSYTRKIVLPHTGISLVGADLEPIQGDTITLRLTFAASSNPTIEIRTGSASGTVLLSVGSTGSAFVRTVQAVWTGAAWQLLDSGAEQATGASSAALVATGTLSGWTVPAVGPMPDTTAALDMDFAALYAQLHAIASEGVTAWNGALSVVRPGGTVDITIIGTASESPSSMDGDGNLLLSVHDNGDGTFAYNGAGTGVADIKLLIANTKLGYDLHAGYTGSGEGVDGASGSSTDGIVLHLVSVSPGSTETISYTGSGSLAGFTGTASGTDTNPVPVSGQVQSVILYARPSNASKCFLPIIGPTIGKAFSLGGWSGRIRLGWSADGNTLSRELCSILPRTADDGPLIIASLTPQWVDHPEDSVPNWDFIALFDPTDGDVAANFGAGLARFFIPGFEIESTD